MNVLYVYGSCSQSKYKELFKSSKCMILQQAQKYHALMTKGLELNGVNVFCVSGLPINRDYSKKVFWNAENEIEDGMHYHYYTMVNLPFFRQLCIFLGGFTSVFRFVKTNRRKNSFIICDTLNIANSYGAVLAAKILKIKTTAIVTDIPGHFAFTPHLSGAKKIVHKIKDNINNFLFHLFDGYVLLTEPMNELVNKKSVPYVIVEGLVDIDLKGTENLIEKKRFPKTVIYAGTLNKVYGLPEFVSAFLSLRMRNYELWIFGDGDYREELTAICKENTSVKYMGVQLNDKIVEEEIRAALLVNPRPTFDEYTRYSFPSKNMEYMVSGTPLLTTKLSGMPKDYFEHVYLIEKESVEGYREKLLEVMSHNDSDRHKKGLNAKTFVISMKNNVIQARKVIELLERELIV